MDEQSRRLILAEFDSAVLDALPAHIAVIDAQGTIISVNAAWRTYGAANGMRDNSYGVGVNYLKVCRAAVDPVARAAEQGIQEVLKGTRQMFCLEYPCHSPDENCWFEIRATSPSGFAGFAVLAHEDITHRVAIEARLQARIADLENRFDNVTDSPALERGQQFSGVAPLLLIVDDDAALLKAVSRVFTLNGALVQTFTNPTEAVDWLRTGNPDFILTDYQMSGMDGDEFIRRARETVGRETPALIMSGKQSVDVVQGAKSVGCELILKPFDGESLFRTILDAVAAVEK